MRHLLGLFGLLAATALVIVSAAMNWRFGFGLGKTEFDGQVYGLASVAADCLKAIAPFLIIYAWKTGKWAQAIAGVALAIICTGYSITSSIGFAATNRADNNGERIIKVTNYQDARTELKRLEDKLSWMPKHRPVEAVAADLNGASSVQVKLRGQKRNTIKALTDDCTKTNWVSRKYCPKIFDLKKELAISEEAEKIEKRIVELRGKLSVATSTAAAGKADPQADLIASLFGLKLEDTQTVLILLVSLLVEAGSSLGYFVVFSMWRLDPRKAMEKVAERDRKAATGGRLARDDRKAAIALSEAAISHDALLSDNDNNTDKDTEETLVHDPVKLPKNEMDRYYEDRIIEDEGQSTTATELYDDYCAWCEDQGSNPMSQIPFGKQMSQRNIQKAKIAGRIRYKGIRLRVEKDQKGIRIGATRVA